MRYCAHADESFVDNDSSDHVVVFITEGEPGYSRSTYTGTLDYCQKVAETINGALGLSSSDVLDIRSSSMRVSRIG